MDFKIESLPQKSGGLAALQMYARAAVYSIVGWVTDVKARHSPHSGRGDHPINQ